MSRSLSSLGELTSDDRPVVGRPAVKPIVASDRRRLNLDAILRGTPGLVSDRLTSGTSSYGGRQEPCRKSMMTVGRSFEGFIFDLDGTIYIGSNLIPGASAVIRTIRESGRGVVFLTNNPEERPEGCAVRLTQLGNSRRTGRGYHAS